MPIAYWCILVAGLMPAATATLAKTGGGYDNRDPRAFQSMPRHRYRDVPSQPR